MEKLKQRWGIESNFQIVIIFIVFAITGSVSAKLAAPLTELIGITKENVSGWIYWPIRILLIFPLYQVLLVFFGWLFGQHKFFWAFEKKMLRRLGLGSFLK
ncbi:DUF6787 family protein [uncultured Croceitalea sp.]|uniref:DUF6787 family protein n=1 Tax=uncultured Croceitalea sp. TaxID=1798908 RepID=UPI0033067B28